MEKQPENDKEDGSAENIQDQEEDAKKEKEDDASDPSKETNGNRELLKAEFLYSILAYLGLATALVGVSVNQNV